MVRALECVRWLVFLAVNGLRVNSRIAKIYSNGKNNGN
jgi:hypothetical protein